MQRLVITATGTGVGKTYLTCQMIRQLKTLGKTVAAMKPVISGFEAGDKGNDVAMILEALEQTYSDDSIEEISLYRFAAPLSPDMAAEKESREIDFDALLTFCNRINKVDITLIEGVGGVMVPLNKDKTTLDMMKALGAPAILVCSNYLGAISHTLTACSTLLSTGITLKAIVISVSENNEIDTQDMKNTLSHFLNTPIYIVPHGGNPSAFLSELI